MRSKQQCTGLCVCYNSHMDKLSHYHQESRPWGSFQQFTLNEPSTVKIIKVKPHEAFSLQTHSKRKEFWYILSGTATITHGNEQTEAQPGDTFMIEMGMNHRAEAHDDELTFLEISFGTFDETDITRLEDNYGRV